MESNSGYSGGWIPPPDRSTFNNLYYIVMLQRPWVKTTKTSILDPSATLTEWRSPLVVIDAMMLNIDAILGFNIDDGCNVFGEEPFDFLTEGGADFVPDVIQNCVVRTDEYGTAVQDFAASNDVWLEEYVSAFTKMVDDTVPCEDLRLPSCSAPTVQPNDVATCVAHLDENCACDDARNYGLMIKCATQEIHAVCAFDVTMPQMFRGVGKVLKSLTEVGGVKRGNSKRNRLMARRREESIEYFQRNLSDISACGDTLLTACGGMGDCDNMTDDWFGCLDGTIYMGSVAECNGYLQEDIWESIAITCNIQE